MTSIEWLIEKLGWNNRSDAINRIVDEAKEMHRFEIEEAFKHGKLPPFLGQVQTAKEYYQETFGSKGTDTKDVVLGYISLDAQILNSQLSQQDTEKEMFELEQQLDIPSHMRWHNREEPKQETTLEEAAESLFPDSSIQKRIFIKGAKWQEKHSKSLSDKWKEYQDWLNEPPEISDEEIEKCAEEYYSYDELYDGLKGMIISAKKGAWFDAIKWYREQLKNK
jgi:hypothetical protein